MEITFWGVRGSIPTPLTSKEVQEKVTAVVQRISSKDIASPDAMQRFLASLPPWVFGTVGGNTACVEVRSDTGTDLIFDAGSGIRVLGKSAEHANDKVCHLLLSHFHWDHIQGLPFFDKAYNPNVELNIYSPFERQHELLAAQMHGQYYPVEMDASFTKNTKFHLISPDKPFEIGDLKVSCQRMRHPGGSYAYSIKEGDKKFVYATDSELTAEDFKDTKEKKDFFGKANMLLFDAQYTLDEALHKEHWGHSSFSHAIDFATVWGINSIIFFHHEPTYDDKKLSTILLAARKYIDYSYDGAVEVRLATEGQKIRL